MCARSIGLPHWHVGPHATLLQVGATVRTWLMCTPSERCTPLQERQMKQPRLADALVHEPASSATNKRTGSAHAGPAVRPCIRCCAAPGTFSSAHQVGLRMPQSAQTRLVGSRSTCARMRLCLSFCSSLTSRLRFVTLS